MYNSWTGVGNLASDPEVRYTKNGKQVASFTLCCDTGFGENKKTEFVKCIAWESLAKIVAEYLHKGSKCLVVGPMTTRKWQDKDGNDRYTTEIIARDMKMLGGGKEKQEHPAERYQPPSVGEDSDVPF